MANKKRTNKLNCDSLKEDLIKAVEQEPNQSQADCSGCSGCCGGSSCSHSETSCDQPDTCDNADEIINRGLDFSRRLLVELGINPDMRGYDYIDIGIDLCIKNAVKDVFSEIAKVAGTTKGVVSSAIGAAFKKVEPARFDYFWEKYDIAPFEKIPAYEILVNLLAVVVFENDYDFMLEMKN